MGNESVQRLRLLNKISDFAVFVLAFILGALTHWLINPFSPSYEIIYFEKAVFLLILFCTTNYIFLSINKIYPTSRLRPFGEITRMYFKAVYSALIAIIVMVFVFKAKETSRLLLASASTYCFLLLLLKEYAIRQLIIYLRYRGQNLRPVVLVGQDEKVIEHVREEITGNHILGIHPLGVFTLSDIEAETIGGYENLGSVHNMIEYIEENAVENVIFLTHDPHQKEIEQILFKLEQRGIEVWLKLGLLERPVSKVSVDHLHNVPFLTFRMGPQNQGALMTKNLMDRIIAASLLVLFSPLFVIIPVIIRLTSPGPVFFKQYRLGRLGKKFVFYKFRSMVTNAEQLKENLITQNEMEGPVFKIKEDPRITSFGKFLRRTSLDELPQLWNVFKGDMSLVGPRPPLAGEVKEYHEWQRRRLSMKPGITCIWQVMGRSRVVRFEDWVKMDLDYIDNWSLWLDFKILVKTIPAVVFSKGAH